MTEPWRHFIAVFVNCWLKHSCDYDWLFWLMKMN